MRGKRTDLVHRECLKAIKLLDLPHRDLSATGKGVEDILVCIRDATDPTIFPYWLVLEAKTPKNKTNANIWESQITPAQKAWHEKTKDAPREIVTGFQDTLAKLRSRMGI